MSRAYKKMSSHGSISIPVAMRRELGIEGKDPMVIEQEEGKITITPFSLRCNFCKSTDGVQEFYGKGICNICAAKVQETLGGGI